MPSPILMAIGDIMSFRCDSRLNGQQMLLDLYYRVDGIDLSDDVELFQFQSDFFGALDAADMLTAAIANCYSQDVTNIVYYMQKIYPNRYIATPFIGASEVGTVAVGALPQNVAIVDTLRWLESGRHFISNKHMGGVPTTFAADGMITDLGRGRHTTLIEQEVLVRDVDSQGNTLHMVPIIFNRNTVVNSAQIMNGYVQETTRIMRRRTVGLGS